MDISIWKPKYSFKEKFFKISPEEKIGRTDYTIRVVCIWLILVWITFYTQTILLYAMIFTGLIVGKIIMYTLLIIPILGLFIQAYKRINDYNGSKGIYWFIVSITLYAILSTIFEFWKGTESIENIITFYIILISVFKSPEEKNLISSQAINP